MVDLAQMVRLEDLPSSEMGDVAELSQWAEEAQDFLIAHKWCKAVRRGFFDRECAGLLAVFYFEIEPARPEVDDAVWVIVGDLPPAYIDVISCPNGAAAIDGYLGAMREWVEAAKQGRSVEGLIPVRRRGSLIEVEPNVQFAGMLEKRLQFIEEEILPEFEDELEE